MDCPRVGELHFCTGGELYDFAEVFAGVGAGFVGAGGREVLDAGGKCSAYRGDVFGGYASPSLRALEAVFHAVVGSSFGLAFHPCHARPAVGAYCLHGFSHPEHVHAPCFGVTVVGDFYLKRRAAVESAAGS